MRKIYSFMHISLDGFVAGPKGEMNWIQINQEIFDFVEQRISQTDTALYGRVTYDMMESYWPEAGNKPNASKHDKNHSKWYAGAHKIVLSRSLKGKSLANTTIISDDLTESIRVIKNSGEGQPEDILLFGSPSATHALLELDLIDGFWLLVNPILLGEGIPLFKGIHAHTKLKLRSSHTFSGGVVALDYIVEK